MSRPDVGRLSKLPFDGRQVENLLYGNPLSVSK